MKRNEEKLQALKEYFGWDDEFISKFTPRELYMALKIMRLEEEVK